AGAAAPPRPLAVRLDLYGDPLPPGAVARLGTVRLRQPLGVWQVSFSQSGQQVLSVGERSLLVLDVPSRKLARRLALPFVSSLPEFSTDGRLVALELREGAAVVHVLDPVGKRGHRFLGPRWSHTATALSPDGSRLAIADLKGTVHRWDLARGIERGQPIRTVGKV